MKHPKLILSALLCLALILFIGTAWVCDDAYISFRTIDNFVKGMGLTWNPGERVQAYTHPLWLFGLSFCFWITKEIFLTSMMFSILVSIFTLTLVGFQLIRDKKMAILGLCLLILSKAFVDFSTSGLESPLTHLLLTLFFITYLKETWSSGSVLKLSLLTSLILLNRMDLIWITLPPLCFALYRTKKPGGLLAAAGGVIPFLLWEVFATWYYGFPFPNTAYAKLNTGIEMGESIRQGLLYLENSFEVDPITILTILLAVVTTLTGRCRILWPIMAGVLLHLGYTLRVGGDFMSGRFLTAPFLASVILVSYSQLTKRVALRWLLVILLLVSFSGNHPTLFLNKRYGWQQHEVVDYRGIADERAYYYWSSGLLTTRKNNWQVRHPWALQGAEARAKGLKVVLRMPSVIGYFGYFAGPGVHIIDVHGLADALLAKLPAMADPYWRIGHFARKVPEGYQQTLETGVNSFQDKQLGLYYDKLSFIIRGPLWDRNRLLEIWRMNRGDYDSLINRKAYRYPDRIFVDRTRVANVKPEGTVWNDPGNIILPYSGIEIALQETLYNKKLEISLDNNDDYEIQYFLNGNRVARQKVEASYKHWGLAIYTLNVPRGALRQGYDSLVVLPLVGDLFYSLGHIYFYE